MSNLLDGLAPWPAEDFSVYGEVEVKKLSRIQKLVGSFLGRNWVAIPHVTHTTKPTSPISRSAGGTTTPAPAPS